MKVADAMWLREPGSLGSRAAQDSVRDLAKGFDVLVTSDRFYDVGAALQGLEILRITDSMAQYLRAAMALAGMSSRSLGAALGVSHASVSNWTRGTQQIPPARCKEIALLLPAFDLDDARALWLAHYASERLRRWDAALHQAESMRSTD